MNRTLASTSERLTEGELYSRVMLAKFFGLPPKGSINTGVFRPDKSCYSSIWLFVTEEKSSEMTQLEGKLVGDTLNWQGQSEQGADHLIINHQSLALEILLFYRKHKHEHAHGAFVYEGVFVYQSHEERSKPTNFVLTRKSSQGLSLAADSLPGLIPSGPVDTLTLSDFVGASELCAPLYFFLSILSLLRTHGASSLNFVPSPWLTGNIFSNLLVARRDHGIKFDNDQALDEGLLQFNELETTTADQELNLAIENYARRFGCAELKSISALVLQKFLEPFGTALTATQQQIFTDAEDTFAEAIVPFRISESDLFLQVHPLWISYFQDNLPSLTELFLTKLCGLLAIGNDSKEDVLAKLFYFDRAILLSCLSGSANSIQQPSLELKSDQLESVAKEEEEEQLEQMEASIDLPKDTTETNQLLLPFKTSEVIDTSQLTLPLIKTQASGHANISLNCSAFMAALSKLPPISQLYFLSLLRCLEQQSETSGTVPQSILGEKFYKSLWLLTRRGLQVGVTDLINDLHELKERPDANSRLYNHSFVAELARAIRNSLSNEHLKKVQKLGIDFKLFSANQSKATSNDIPQLVLAVHQSHVSVCDQTWLRHIQTELASLKVWTATQFCLSLALLNPNSKDIHKKIFALQTDLRDAVAKQLSELEISTNQNLVTSKLESFQESVSLPAQTTMTQVQQFELKQPEILQNGTVEVGLNTVEKLFTNGSLFSGVSPADGAAAIQSAFERIVEKLSEKEAPRSLCQLEINNSDYLWLTTWLKILDIGTARHFLKDRCYARISNDSQYTNQQAIGCLLMLSCSEINRREGQEGSIWPLFFVSVDTSLNPIILSHIFDGSASLAVTEAFRATIQALKLRNVMNTEDHSQFLITTFLQFGFSRYGIRHLPTWLRSQNWTESVRNLLSENSPNRSETFCQLWESCRRFLDRRMSVDDFRHELINSPWVLPDWHDDIVRVLANPDDRFSLPVPGTGRHLRFESVPPVTAKFIWNPLEKPLFTIAFAFERLGLEEGQVYTVLIDDSPYRLSQPSEYLWQLSAKVKIPLEKNEVSVEILAEDKTSIFSSTLMLWRQDDVQIFDILSGRLLNEQPSLRADRAYAILASADLKLEPQPSHKLSLPRMGRELYLLQPGWAADTRVMLDDEILWAAGNNAEAPDGVEQQWSVTAVLERRSLAPGEPIKIVFKGENSDTKVEALRVSGISVPIAWNGERTETQQAVDLGSDALRGHVDLTVKVRHQNNLRVRRQKLAVSLTGCASWNGVAWTTLSEDSVLTLDECKRNQFYFRYKPLENADYSDYAIFEGNTLRSRLTSDRMSISALSGSGGVLEIRKIFNAGVDAPRIIIARGVTDPGIVAEVSDINASEMRLELKEAKELSERHQIIIWPDDSKPIFLSPADMRKVNDRAWDFVPCTASTNIAVALAYDGMFLGASWAPDTRTFLERIQYRMEPVEIAALLAWMRWPLLLKENLSAARMFAKHHPHETLSAWLNENGLDPNLKTDGLSATESWHSVTRQIFAFWSPTKETILQLTNTLTNANEQYLAADSIVLAAKRLWFSCPELMAKYLHVAFNNCSNQTQAPLNQHKILESIEEAILAGATGNTMRRADLFEQCADEFDVDPKFLTDQSEEAVTLLFKARTETSQDTINRNNLFLLQSKLKGRQVLALAIINYFKQTPR